MFCLCFVFHAAAAARSAARRTHSHLLRVQVADQFLDPRISVRCCTSGRLVPTRVPPLFAALFMCIASGGREWRAQWLESNRAVMDADHVKAGWFLTYRNGSVLNVPRTGTPTDPLLSQWIVDWRNPAAAAYFVDAVVKATFLPGVDATFTDDLPGVPAEHPEVQPATGLSNASLARLQFATQQGEGFLATSLAVEGKFCWYVVVLFLFDDFWVLAIGSFHRGRPLACGCCAAAYLPHSVPPR